jgi:hypothetical protein
VQAKDNQLTQVATFSHRNKLDLAKWRPVHLIGSHS